MTIWVVPTLLLTLFSVITGRGNKTLTRGKIDFDYRVADTVKAMYHGPFSKLRVKIPASFPDSIAARYVNESAGICANVNGAGLTISGIAKRQKCYDDKVRTLDNILCDRCPTLGNFTNGDIMHIRLGDAFCVETEYVIGSLRPPTAQEAMDIAKKYHNLEHPFTFIYSTHGGCEDQTSSFLSELTELIQDSTHYRIEEGVGWSHADKHLCAMVDAHLFIQGAGGFSYLAERVRARRGFPTVQELVVNPIIWLQADLELKHQNDKPTSQH